MHPLSQLEFTSPVAKRAQYEAFEFTLVSGAVQIRNGSHEHPSEHEYLVRIDDGVPASCTCLADEHYEGACKHRVAVAIRRPLVDAIATKTDPKVVAPDGGRIDTQADSGESGSVPDRECSECLDDFPCWECVRTGKKPIPE
ncbi:SWIM zinc finger family protein [Halosimplex pelagicum]|uniref:SWIM zinc finger family protein n=1 Tax=Halosimplex pelagicum TaxID=869886 RepID=A0A7D5PAZ2_9EURY|nr:SWIM zinc finger family protein [Halosimplex pelagicum]QLH81378.1 SWIM zinc finger family protein [Halosimplex pelagicum]